MALAALAVPAGADPPAPGTLATGGSRWRWFRGCRGQPGVAACEGSLSAALGRAGGGEEEFRAAYELQGELGRGSFGIVQRARHVPTGQLRAVKRLKSRARGGLEEAAPALAELSLGEVEVMASLNHPNVAGLYEYFKTSEELLLVQELCEGDPLEAKIERARGRGLGVRDAALALRQMLEAVRHCHERGFVHRDLKADNFVFASPEPSAELKLIDFGLAAQCGHGELLAGRAGTVDYSPPEALRDAYLGPPADMWALGAIFFLLLTGEPLIKVDQPGRPSEELRQILQGQVTRKVLDAQYVRLRVASATGRVPLAAADLLEDLLQQEPAKRITAEQALRHPFILSNTPQAAASQ